MDKEFIALAKEARLKRQEFLSALSELENELTPKSDETLVAQASQEVVNLAVKKPLQSTLSAMLIGAVMEAISSGIITSVTNALEGLEIGGKKVDSGGIFSRLIERKLAQAVDYALAN
jgi:hypothetical protein